jgi:hypothetical protein
VVVDGATCVIVEAFSSFSTIETGVEDDGGGGGGGGGGEGKDSAVISD